MGPKLQNRKSVRTSSPKGGTGRNTMSQLDKDLKSPPPPSKRRSNQKQQPQMEEYDETENPLNRVGESRPSEADDQMSNIDLKLAGILKAVKTTNQSLNTLTMTVAAVQTDISVIRDDLNKMRQRIKEYETLTTELQKETNRIKKRIEIAERDNKALKEKNCGFGG